MINFLQINLHRSGEAQRVMYETASNHDVHLILVSEQLRHSEGPRWIPDDEGKCAIALTSSADFPVESKGAVSGFVWIQTGNLRIYSCYLPPGRMLDRYRDQLAALEQSVRSAPPELNLVVGGDFNAKFPWKLS